MLAPATVATVATASALPPAKPPSLNLHFADYLNNEGDNVGEKYNDIILQFSKTGTMTERPIGEIRSRIKELMELSKSRPKSAPLRPLRPKYNTLGVGASISAPSVLPPLKPLTPVAPIVDEERRQRQEARLKLLASLSKEKIKYIQAYANLQRMTLEEIKAKIMNEYSTEEWRLGGLKKSELIKAYLEKAGLTPPEKKKKKKGGGEGRASD